MLDISILVYFALGLHICFVGGTELPKRDDGFVTSQNGQLQLNGSPYRYYGTNAYWLPMTTDEDMDTTFHDIATAGFQVVRTWAFNDVAEKPSSGAYFQILKDSNPTINTGADGLQRLDRVVATANKYGIKLLFTLTNNWNPQRPQPSSSFSKRNNDVLPRGYLSNDYGGMDRYVDAFCPGSTHDQFYTKPEIISAFKSYVSAVVTRYCDNPTVLGWELGNDLRCSSTIPGSSSCNSNTITKWVADISSYIKTIDFNHLITAGDGGFYCIGCAKLYAKTSQFQQKGGLTGPTFDGSYGVDTEDIISVPSIDFGSL